MYNNENILVAIDELDAGIFEYLLGEILEILSKNARGQLIFTSHNLRALEKLNKDLVIFTTTNPENRYIGLNSIKGMSNLRDFYYICIFYYQYKFSRLNHLYGSYNFHCLYHG